ncbi:MAG: hypothetical protein VX911_03260 [Candidatus Latescibacterota bacterium]|nr:hypothetical protein [Candidatus Latescibacterota bacterium]
MRSGPGEIYRRRAERHDITLVTGNYPGGQRQEEAEGIRFVCVGTGRRSERLLRAAQTA